MALSIEPIGVTISALDRVRKDLQEPKLAKHTINRSRQSFEKNCEALLKHGYHPQ